MTNFIPHFVGLCLDFEPNVREISKSASKVRLCILDHVAPVLSVDFVIQLASFSMKSVPRYSTDMVDIMTKNLNQVSGEITLVFTLVFLALSMPN